MNSVEQARARKRAAMPSFGGAPPPGDIRSKVPSPPPTAVQKRPSLVESEPPAAASLQRSHSIGGNRKALPNIPAGAVTASPKAGRIAQQLSAGGGVRSMRPMEGSTDDDVDDDIDATLRRMDGTATPTDPMDQMTGDEYQLTTQTFGSRITPEFLRSRTGFEDLHLVTSTELIVDTRHTVGADSIGEWMPRLVELRLNHSHIQTFRDLGSKFLELQILHLNNAHVTDIRGIASCAKLRELYIAFNSLRQLSDLCALPNLQVLDAEGNRVEDIAEVESLVNITTLEALCLSGNPVEVSMGSARFRTHVVQCMPHLQRLDDIPVTGASAAHPPQLQCHADPMHRDLMRELYLVQDSIRTNISMDRGLEGSIEEQHRKLYSRQSTSCSGARRRTPASQSTPRSSARHDTHDARSLVNSAPEARSPKKVSLPPSDGSCASSAAATTPSVEGRAGNEPSFLNRNVLQQAAAKSASHTPPGGVGKARDGDAASILTSGGAMFSGSLAQSLRRRLPSLGGKITAQSVVLSDATLDQIKADVVGRQGPNEAAAQTRTLREHELVQRLSQLKTAHEEGTALPPSEAAALERLLDEMGLEFDMECVGGNDASELEAFKREEFARHLQEERPQFLDRYKDMQGGTSSDDDGPRGSATASSSDRLTDAEMIREIAKLKQRTLRETTGSMIEDPQQYESLQMSDLGANVDDVL